MSEGGGLDLGGGGAPPSIFFVLMRASGGGGVHTGRSSFVEELLARSLKRHSSSTMCGVIRRVGFCKYVERVGDCPYLMLGLHHPVPMTINTIGCNCHPF